MHSPQLHGLEPNMPGQIEKTVFISYRRTNFPWALAVYQNLQMHKYDVFFDFKSIKGGDYEQTIFQNIKGRAHFVVILTPSALERCNEPDDWLRREIELALDEKRNIVPLILEGFNFDNPAIANSLTGKMTLLRKYNGLNVPADYFQEAMARLRNDRLNISLDAVIHPISSKVQQTVKEQQTAANKAMQVQPNELSAQEYFEKGFYEKNPDEKIHFYTEAIRLNPEFIEAYNNRATLYKQYKNDLDSAAKDYTQALRINPDYSFALRSLGNIYAAKGEDIAAYFCLKKVVELEPEGSRAAFIRILRRLGKSSEAEEQAAIARRFIAKVGEYNQSCFESICGNIDNALELLRIGLEKEQVTKEWARQDPDFENIRDDPRFKELVDE